MKEIQYKIIRDRHHKIIAIFKPYEEISIRQYFCDNELETEVELKNTYEEFMAYIKFHVQMGNEVILSKDDLHQDLVELCKDILTIPDDWKMFKAGGIL